MFQTFKSLMEHSNWFQHLMSELTQSGLVRFEHTRLNLLSKTTAVKDICRKLTTRLTQLKELSMIKL